MSDIAEGIIERFLAHAEAQPQTTALALEGEARSWSYAQLRAELERYRGAFEAVGVGAGDPVLVLLPPGPEFIFAFYALLSMGAVSVPASPKLTAHELGQMLALARPRAAIVDRSLAPALGARLALAPELRAVLSIDAVPAGMDATTLEALAAPARPLVPPAGDPVVTLHFTYKGFGYPLAVPHRYSHFGALMAGVDKYFAHPAGEAHLLFLPMGPVFGLLTITVPLYQGAKMVLIGRDPATRMRIPELLAEHQVRRCCVVPAVLKGLLMLPRQRLDLHPQLALVVGGSYMHPSLGQAVAKHWGIEPQQGYGTTETLPIVCSRPGFMRAGSLGVPVVDGARVYTVDERGRELPVGRAGELVVSGPTVTEGFLARPEETAQLLRGGAFHTGDLGRVDEDGFVYFLGRRLPFTKVGAQMVDLVEVERTLAAHPDVLHARAYVRSDGQDDGELQAQVIGRSEHIDPKALIAHCKAFLSKHKVPSRINVVPHRTAEKAA
jgi:acyl-CoA synthetase (AMP-forming)/AMP-acid ligase II